MEFLHVASEYSSFAPLNESGAYPSLTRESAGAPWESGISSSVDFEAAEPGPTLVTGGQDPDPYFLTPPSCRQVELPLVDPLIGLVQGCWEVPPSEYNNYSTYEIFAGSTDASVNDFIYFSSPSEGYDTSAADKTSQPEFYLEEQELIIHPEIMITTEVDSAGTELETDQTWVTESWWSDPSDTLSDIKIPAIRPYIEDDTWSIPQAWWRGGAMSFQADSGESIEQPYANSIAFGTLPEPEPSIPSSPELLAPKFDYFSQESNFSSQVPGFELSGQELDEPYTHFACPVETKSVPSPVEPLAAYLLDETQQYYVGDDAMVALNLLPDLESILQRLINGSLRG